MTSSLGEIKLVLAVVSDQLGSAYQHAGVALSRIEDAVTVLGDLGEQHSEPLVPAELLHAVEELADGLKLISGGVAAVADLDARL